MRHARVCTPRAGALCRAVAVWVPCCSPTPCRAARARATSAVRLGADASTRVPGGLLDCGHTRYSAQREFTCQRRPGSWLHEAVDVQSYCEWGVDYLKLDACFGRGYNTGNESWIKFRAAIDQCVAKRGFPMVLSVESCDDPSPGGCGGWIGKLANLWRTCGDIQATFGSVLSNVAENTKMAHWAGPSGGPLGGGHWNDGERNPARRSIEKHRSPNASVNQSRKPPSRQRGVWGGGVGCVCVCMC